jgi:hypothetical protein
MANGVKFGRKPKLSPYQREEALKRRSAGETGPRALGAIAIILPRARGMRAAKPEVPPRFEERFGERVDQRVIVIRRRHDVQPLGAARDGRIGLADMAAAWPSSGWPRTQFSAF